MIEGVGKIEPLIHEELRLFVLCAYRKLMVSEFLQTWCQYTAWPSLILIR
jgi:uncharacterized protein YifE (UPF0438 family)